MECGADSGCFAFAPASRSIKANLFDRLAFKLFRYAFLDSAYNIAIGQQRRIHALRLETLCWVSRGE